MIFKIIWKTLLSVTLVLCAILVWDEVRRPRIVVQPFEVPEQLSKSGITGRVVARRLAMKLTQIQEFTSGETMAPDKSFAFPQTVSLDIVIPQVNVSVESVIHFLQRLLSRVKYIDGEVFIEADQVFKVSAALAGDGYVDTIEIGSLLTNESLENAVEKIAVALAEKVDPLRISAYFYLKRSYEDARRAISRCLLNDSSEDDAAALNLLGLVDLYEPVPEEDRQTALKRSIRNFNRATQLDQNMGIAFNNWGVALEELARSAGSSKSDDPLSEEARNKFEEAIRVDPGLALAYANLGRLARHEKDYETAIALFEKAAQLTPRNSRVHQNWGLTILELAEVTNRAELAEQGLEKLEHAYRLDADDITLLLNWAEALINRKRDLEKAEQLATEASLLKSSYRYLAYWYLARVAELRQDDEKLIDNLEKLLEHNPKKGGLRPEDVTRANCQLAELYRKKGLVKESIRSQSRCHEQEK